MPEFLSQIDPFVAIWLVLVIVFLAVELMTVGLSSIWFALGALAALIVAAVGGPVWLQILLFVVFSIGLLVATKPWVTKYINSKTVKTNADRTVGKRVIIAERVDNVAQTGMAVVDGQEWTVRAATEGDTFEVGETVEVVRISGVKLLVKNIKEGE